MSMCQVKPRGQTVSHCVEGIFLKGMNDESAGGGGFSPSIPLLGEESESVPRGVLARFREHATGRVSCAQHHSN